MSHLARIGMGLLLVLCTATPIVWAGGYTQRDMNRDAYNRLKQVDVALNYAYTQVLMEYQEDRAFTAKLIDAELAWIAFRDAELEALYPGFRDKPWRYGSVLPMAYVTEKTLLTRERVEQLQEWLDGMVEDRNIGTINLAELNGSPDEIKQRAGIESQQADAALYESYKQILILYQDNRMFIDKLTDAGLAWITFRDAELEAIDTVRNKEKRFGRFSLAAYELEKARLTWARVAQVKQWLDGVPEGTVGAGSRSIYGLERQP